MSTVCMWCGDPTDTERKKLCGRCKDMHVSYQRRIARLFHTTPTKDLVKFRNSCMDMVEFRRHGAEDLPRDLDYQLERVNRILKERDPVS